MGLSALADFHFLHPWWLLALPALWALAAWFGWRRRQDGNWSQLIDAELLPALRLEAGGRGGSLWWLIALAWTLATLALAGPAWQREQSSAFRSPAAWVLMLDLSPSMAATDLSPDRATRARYALDDLLGAAKDARVGLIAFAGEAHTVTPLTEDIATVRALLPPLAPGLMPESGDTGAPALNEAGRLLHAADMAHGEVVMLSDGIEDAAAAFAAAQRLRQQGARLNIVGVGTAQGAPLPDGKGGFVRDAQGRSTLTRLQSDQLQRLAALGGGEYVPLADLSQLVAHLQAAAPHTLDAGDAESGKAVAHWRNGGIWLLPLLLVLCALLARRGWL